MQQRNANEARPGINLESLKSLKLIWPSIDYVLNYKEKIENCIKLIFIIAKQNTKLHEARDIFCFRG